MATLEATDVQLLWPSGLLGPMGPAQAGAAAERADRAERIEAFFRERWQREVVVAPSARGALALILRHLKLNRTHRVFAHRWSPHCVWSVVTPYASPTTTSPETADLAMVHHMLGYPERFTRAPVSTVIVEDSCDSVVLEGSGLFPNGGQFEVFSLPKTMGCCCGGLVVTRDPAAAEPLRQLSRAFDDLNLYQARLRRQEGEFASWEHREYQNFALDLNSLEHILECLPKWEENAATIQRRLRQIETGQPELWSLAHRPEPYRLPCQLAVLTKHLPNAASASHRFMTWHVNSTHRVDDEQFHPCGLAPLHFGIDQAGFELILGGLASARGASPWA